MAGEQLVNYNSSEGCTFGQLLAKDVQHLTEKIEENKAELRTLATENKESHGKVYDRIDALETTVTESLNELKAKVDQHEMIRTGGTWVIMLVVTAVVNFFFDIFKGRN